MELEVVCCCCWWPLTNIISAGLRVELSRLKSHLIWCLSVCGLLVYAAVGDYRGCAVFAHSAIVVVAVIQEW